jgi:adenosine deaminase/aminodeoxyfutalosine deaminase
MSIEAYIRALPKAEVHLHLEGAIELPTLCRLASAHGLPEPSPDLYKYTGFTGFLKAFKLVCDHLNTPQDYHLVTLRMIERLKRDGVAYAEVYIAAGVMLWRGQNFDEMFEGIEAGAQEGYTRHGVVVRWILDATRQFGPDAAMRMAKLAARFHTRGVIAIGIGGDENNGAPEAFREVYDYARRHGLRLTAHAGEVAGPESVWGALRELQAERLGHGVTAERDPELVRHLAATGIPVDICLSSNVRTGAVAGLDRHPLRRYFDAGVLVALGTDDPAMFETDLTREYLLAHERFGFGREDLARLAANSFRASFLSEAEKSRYIS